MLEDRRVAVVHDWLTGRRGAERVLEQVLALCPRADLFTLVRRRGAVPLAERGRRVTTSWLDRLPASHRYVPALLPFLNGAAGRLPLEGYDLVISVSHCAAKNVRVAPDASHLCYCQTPARYAWDLYPLYTRGLLRGPGRLLAPLAREVRDRFRVEDVEGARRVTRFVSTSRFVARRVERCYGRSSEVVHPPVDTERFARAARRTRPGERFLVLSAVRPNKRVEEIVRAFATLDLPLDVAGPAGRRARRRLRRLAGPRTRILGEVPDEDVEALVAGCRALVHAATEDFGIAPVEAMAAGRPVIGYACSGLEETVAHEGASRTGLLFDDPTPEGIADAVRRFEAIEPDLSAEACRAQAERFAVGRFRERFARVLREVGGQAGAPRASAREACAAAPGLA